MTLKQQISIAFSLGHDAYFNSVPKTYQQGGSCLQLYNAWHEGWLEAWKQDTMGQIKMGVFR